MKLETCAENALLHKYNNHNHNNWIHVLGINHSRPFMHATVGIHQAYRLWKQNRKLNLVFGKRWEKIWKSEEMSADVDESSHHIAGSELFICWMNDWIFYKIYSSGSASFGMMNIIHTKSYRVTELDLARVWYGNRVLWITFHMILMLFDRFFPFPFFFFSFFFLFFVSCSRNWLSIRKEIYRRERENICFTMQWNAMYYYLNSYWPNCIREEGNNCAHQIEIYFDKQLYYIMSISFCFSIRLLVCLALRSIHIRR